MEKFIAVDKNKNLLVIGGKYLLLDDKNKELYKKGSNYEFIDVSSNDTEYHTIIPEDFSYDGVKDTVNDTNSNTDKGEKYLVTVRNRHTGKTVECDAYDIIEALKITCPSMAHALKKLMYAGVRGFKDYGKDCKEAIHSITQSVLLEKYRKK